MIEVGLRKWSLEFLLACRDCDSELFVIFQRNSCTISQISSYQSPCLFQAEDCSGKFMRFRQCFFKKKKMKYSNFYMLEGGEDSPWCCRPPWQEEQSLVEIKQILSSWQPVHTIPASESCRLCHRPVFRVKSQFYDYT